jgi:DNA-binding Lrp family transcriptional regulator
MGNQLGYVWIMSEVGKEEEVVRAIENVSGVKEVWRIVFGTYDVLVKLATEGNTALGEIVQREIRKIPSIRSTITFPVVEE